MTDDLACEIIDHMADLMGPDLYRIRGTQRIQDVDRTLRAFWATPDYVFSDFSS